MATTRLIKTNFWKDGYVVELDPIEKLLFLYFISNPQTTLAGVYEINLREVAFDTGIDKDMVQKVLARFCNDGKMYYEKGWLVLNNFLKHQNLNPSVEKGIKNAIASLPKWLQEILTDQSKVDVQLSLLATSSTQPVDSLSTESDNIIKYNLNKINLNKSNKTKTPAASQDLDKQLAAKEKQARTRKSDGMTKSVSELFGGK